VEPSTPKIQEYVSGRVTEEGMARRAGVEFVLGQYRGKSNKEIAFQQTDLILQSGKQRAML
jgi:hypothetical protein